MNSLSELKVESQEAVAIDLYFETMLDSFSAPYRYMARRARESGPFYVSENHFLAPHIIDMAGASQEEPAVCRYHSMIDMKYQSEKRRWKISFLLNI